MGGSTVLTFLAVHLGLPPDPDQKKKNNDIFNTVLSLLKCRVSKAHSFLQQV